MAVKETESAEYESTDQSPNYEMAAKWYKQAAEQGSASSQSNLGAMYAFGKGVPKNYTFAFIWAYASSKQGNANGRKLSEFLRIKHLSSAEHWSALALAKKCVEQQYKGC